MTDKLRIAIVNSDKCKPKKCNQECKKVCPVVKMGKLCIEVTPNDKIATISEELCIGCGLCQKRCPFDAIQIINLPKSLSTETTHRYNGNGFKLHRLPMPRPGQVLGLVGINGIGKSTALKILAKKLKPNLGKYDNIVEWDEIIKYFRGSELQSYFTKLLQDSMRALIKPQYIDIIPKVVTGKVRDILRQKDEKNLFDVVVKQLDLDIILDRSISDLSGGELQRFAIAVTSIQNANVYIYDEPSSYLDVHQRLRAAEFIRSLLLPNNYIIAVDHDLAILDYLSDFVCCLYGTPGAYGVISLPFSVREGINIFMSGFLPTENMRFRDYELNFKIKETDDIEIKKDTTYTYPIMSKTFIEDNKPIFKLSIEAGTFTNSEIIVLLGRNGTGKTTFIKMLAGILKPDDDIKLPELNISYKPQMISPKFTGSVRDLLLEKIRDSFLHPQFNTDVLKPLNIPSLLNSRVQDLSGGELQRVAITLCLGKPADIYLLDEPSAYLDAEQRIITARVTKRFILHSHKTAFVVEHDFMMATYLADRVIVYDGQPSQNCQAHAPQSLVSGLNSFLKQMQITFRRDPDNHRPRINKLNSVNDREQKTSGIYFELD